MKVHYDIEQLPKFNNSVLTIGSFDGVHLGHKSILDQLKNEAKKINGETIVITFHPHPRKIIQHEETPALLTSSFVEPQTFGIGPIQRAASH